MGRIFLHSNIDETPANKLFMCIRKHNHASQWMDNIQVFVLEKVAFPGDDSNVARKAVRYHLSVTSFTAFF